jgi:hypothetical protein
MYSFYTIKSTRCIGKPLPDRECPNDAAAIDEAKKLLEDDAIDVWRGIRFVAHLDPKRSDPPDITHR